MTVRRKASIAGGTLLVLAGCGYGAQSLLSHLASDRAASASTAAIDRVTCLNRGATVVMREGAARECVGITDGSFSFVPGNAAVSDVLGKIEKENRSVRQQARAGAAYVSIAYLLPISATGGGVETNSTVARQLEGAFTAQHYANRNNVQGTRPLIQLLVASSGTSAAEWRAADADIENDVASQHLVAVAGIGISLSTTVKEVDKLADNRNPIPVFGSSITSDRFDNVPNMVRVVPSNDEDVSAILKFIGPTVHTAILIEDTNPSDSYDSTLISEFDAKFNVKGHRTEGPLTYTTAGEISQTDPVGQVNATTIGQMVTNICQGPATSRVYVLFAGRGRELAQLLGDLGTRICQAKPITILTGDAASNMPPVSGGAEVLRSLANVTVDFAGEANPAEWLTGAGTVFEEGRAGFRQFSTAFTGLFPKDSDNDGNAMIGYDAMYAAITATRMVGTRNQSPAAVAGKLSLLKGPRTVLGATGPIDLSADYLGSKLGSNPVNKVIPILRWIPDRTVSGTISGTIAFAQLEYPPF